MSCSIEESTTTLLESNTLNQLNQQQIHPAPAASPLITNSQITNQLGPFQTQTNSNSMTATNPSPKPSLINMINTSQNQSANNNGNSQKIVQAGLGNQLIITTVFQGGSPQKVVTVSSTNNNNNTNNNSTSSVASSSASSSVSSSSSVGSTSPQSSSSNLSLLQSSTPILQAAINGGTNQQSNNLAASSNIASSSNNSNNNNNQQSATTTVSPPDQIRQTITLNSDQSNNNTNNNPSTQNINNYPIQQSQHQYTQFVDSTDNVSHGQGVSVFSPLSCTNNMQQQQQQHQQNNNAYYTYQNTPQSYNPHQNLLTTNLNLLSTNQQVNQPTTTTVSLHSPPTSTQLTNAMNNADFQQHQQIQQQQQVQQQQVQQQQVQQQQVQHQQQHQQQPQPQPIYYVQSNMYQDQSINENETPMEYEGHVAHTAQAAPITVQWLIDNFEPAEGCSLRRSTLYNYYLHHCTEQKLEPVNPASFGKLIRSVFLGLRTRRLGTRGNSKYHYYGIRVKVSSPLNQLSDDHTFAIRNHPMSLSPTGSPGPQPPQSPIPSASNVNSTPAASSHKFSNKRAKTTHYNNNNNNASNNNNFDTNSNLSNPQAEYKPVINQNENPQQQQQPPPIMAVIINNGNMVKTAPQTTTIAKALKQNDNRANVQQQMPVQQQHAQNNQQQNHQSNNNNEIIKHQNENNTQHLQQQQVQLQQQQQQQQVQHQQQPQQQQVQHQQQQQQQPQQVQHQQQPQQPNSTMINGTELTEEELNRLFLNGSAHQIPNFGSINLESFQLPANCTIEDVKKFEELYKDQCEKILDLVVGLKLLDIENIWHMFWRSPHINHKFYEDQMCTQKFMSLCDCPEIIEFTKQSDYQFYQFCIEILIPDVLGTLPTTLVQSIRQLAKHLESWLRNALVNVPEAMKQSKMQIINTFSMTLRRYTSLNHLAQTVKNSLQNENILTQMLHDITKVDFSYIKEQAKWTCDCDERMINRFEKEFKDSLSNYTSTMDSWITWLDTSVDIYLRQFEGSDRYAKMARQFLLKWSFLCSSIIRDLTLRSAASFGSFHLIRLLYDEYMYYIIEHKIANEFRLTPLAVMSCEELRPVSNIPQNTANMNM